MNVIKNAVTALCVALVCGIGLLLLNQGTESAVPACATEDSSACLWDAQVRGNHQGRSVYNPPVWLDRMLTEREPYGGCDEAYLYPGTEGADWCKAHPVVKRQGGGFWVNYPDGSGAYYPPLATVLAECEHGEYVKRCQHRMRSTYERLGMAS